ncbi:MAG: hypothetical protein DWQ01_18365 [Planctomycetota bacterium]|nr:MAG: hypothetical protein DWQ01_18365 [Planctomycetota bacterium]
MSETSRQNNAQRQDPSPATVRDLKVRQYQAGDLVVRLQCNLDEVHQLAARLWHLQIEQKKPNRCHFIEMSIEELAASPSAPLQRKERWQVDLPEIRLQFGSVLNCRMDLEAGSLKAEICRRWLQDCPLEASRLFLESPMATFMSSRGWQVLHAAALVRPAGAIVVRGANGTGKSTLAAAAWLHGWTLLGDESVLVHRQDPSRLCAAVQELAVRPDIAARLEVQDSGTPFWNGHETKIRLPLKPASEPAARQARHLATVLLGDFQSQGRARLEALQPQEFISAFSEGAIPQENWFGSPEEIAKEWSERPCYRLNGHQDLAGALQALSSLCHSSSKR